MYTDILNNQTYYTRTVDQVLRIAHKTKQSPEPTQNTHHTNPSYYQLS